MINRWNTWVPNLSTSNISLEAFPINNNLEVEMDMAMDNAWREAYNNIANQLPIRKEDNKMTTNKTNHYCFPTIEKVIINGPATIVYFDDNDRVIVKRMDIDKDDLFSAVAQAYCKKAFGSTSAFHREVLDKLVVQDPKKKNTKNTGGK